MCALFATLLQGRERGEEGEHVWGEGPVELGVRRGIEDERVEWLGRSGAII